MSDYFWGVDVSTRAVSIAWAGLVSGVSTIEFPVSPGKDARRLSIIRERVLLHADAIAADTPPVFVWVEQASGRFNAPSLVYAVGVVQEAIYSALVGLYDNPVQVETVPSGTWKKVALGFGNAEKDEVFHWARKSGYMGTSQDEADALAIAEAARKSVRFGAQDQAA